MKILSKSWSLAAALCLVPLAAWADGTYGELELEPCTNGAVSSTGLYPTQELEDRAMRMEGFAQTD